jgi:hypothetical protein
MGAAAPDASPPPVQEIVDPSFSQSTLDNGTVFWYKPDDPSHPTFKKPILSSLEAARLMFASSKQRPA